ncbi:hypothetical protein B9Z55_006055 [Caenorhabditis nigoni]|uniref:Uncharacterized protein n=1 Tax=Caenorhabditis nigoni TaxID=1611254 RepID=A0A2G5V3G7_9PELO|nr:hypothetical protein B9Z55_006055 [Caenorhabditis nigoni]
MGIKGSGTEEKNPTNPTKSTNHQDERHLHRRPCRFHSCLLGCGLDRTLHGCCQRGSLLDVPRHQPSFFQTKPTIYSDH